MNNYLLCFYIFSILLFISCEEEIDKSLLYGTWQADQFFESDEVKDIDVSNMSFTFTDQNVYTYQSNLNYKEAGKYRIDNQVLYSTDTLSNQRIEKAVRIMHITNDSLHLLMNNGGIEQKIILHKAN